MAALTGFPPVRLLAGGLIRLSNVLIPGDGLRAGPFVSEEELLTMADVAVVEDVIEREERALIHSIIEFGDTVVREVRVPRPDMVAVEADESVSDVLERAIAAGYSRIPVYGEDIDDIVGIVFTKDLIRAVREDHADDEVGTLVRPAHFVPETKRVAELMREMQSEKFHMAIVVDEYGGTAGLVTLEDLIEELVGEIVDEYDVEEPLIEWLPNGDSTGERPHGRRRAQRPAPRPPARGRRLGLRRRPGAQRPRARARRRRVDRDGGVAARRRAGPGPAHRPGAADPARADRPTRSEDGEGAVEATLRRLAVARRRARADAGETSRRPNVRPAGRWAGEERVRHPGRPAQRGQVDTAQPNPRHQGHDRLGEAADHPDPGPRGPQPPRRPGGVHRHAGDAQAAHAARRAAQPDGDRARSATSTSSCSSSTPPRPSVGGTGSSPAGFRPRPSSSSTRSTSPRPHQILAQLSAAGGLDLSAYFPVSGRTGAGVDELVDHLVERLPEGPPYYPDDMVTDVPEAFWVAELVREQLLAVTHDEVPHSVACRVTEWDWPRIRCEILVERDSQKGIVIGRGGAVLKQVGINVRHQLPEGAFIELVVKVDKDWQRRPRALDRLGY